MWSDLQHIKAFLFCFNAAALVVEANATAATADPQRQQVRKELIQLMYWRANVNICPSIFAQRDETSVNYSALTFSERKAHRAKRRNPKEGETIYNDVVRQ